jgi:apolipoprotein N-acyltransferase
MCSIDVKRFADFRTPWLCRAAGLVSGTAMAITNLYPQAVPLQLIALIPILYVATKQRRSRLTIVAVGFYAGLSYTMLQVFALLLPLPITLILILRMTATFVLFVWGAGFLMRGSPISGSVAAGALLMTLDWINIRILSMWGTAQSLARPWSSYPYAIQFVSITGITGIVFFIATVQALLANALAKARLRRQCILSVFVLFVVAIALNLMVSHPSKSGKLTVAAVGWTNSQEDEYGGIFSPRGFDAFFAGPVARAAGRGAELVASPELAFAYSSGSLDEWMDKFRKVAREHDIYLAVGYFNVPAMENRLLFISPDGRVLAQYTKTHLTPFEDFNGGSGVPAIVNIEGFRVGGMICHDDNFTDLSRRYGLMQTQIVVVPTLDWSTVKSAHLQSSIHRAVECRYAVVRAAKDGISAIISPTGQVLARMDHYKEGAGFVVADVPLCSRVTLFSKFGHWPALAAVIYLIVHVVLIRCRTAAALPEEPNPENEKNQQYQDRGINS